MPLFPLTSSFCYALVGEGTQPTQLGIEPGMSVSQAENPLAPFPEMAIVSYTNYIVGLLLIK